MARKPTSADEPSAEPQPEQQAVPEGVVLPPNPTPNLPKPDMVGNRPGQKLLLASIMREDEPTVMMIFPAKLILTLDDHSQVEIPAGPQAIPQRLADHWYLANCGVKRI
jgi:hypothetical protein